MLFTKGLIKLIVVNLRIYNFFGSYLYSIDPNTFKLKFNNTKSLKIELLCKSTVALFLYAMVSAQLLAFQGSFQDIELYEGIFLVTLHSGYVVTLYVYYSRHTQVLELFNSLVSFERQLLRGKVKFLKKHA